jgi:hypothetical protein
MTEMDENTVVLPDGRSVFQDKNGDYWAVANHEDKNAQKLDGEVRALAIRLGDCKARRHIQRGADALVACREEAGLGQAKAKSPPSSSDSPGFGDLIGEGGFIKPPTADSQGRPFSK